MVTMSEDPEHEILLWVGCAGSFDPRAIKVTIALVKILRAAGVNFRVLGLEETCCGETARRLGNEYLGQMQIEQCLETLNQYKVRRILTACPHGYHAFKNEYPRFGAEFEVFHHSEYIRKLLDEGRIRLSKSGVEAVTFHDSCYLGRYNHIYSEPRAVLESVPGLELREPPRHGRYSMCCGAGGGRMWMEENLGTRINAERTAQLLSTDARLIAVACPYCLTMISDGIKDKKLEETHQVRDLAEIVADHLVTGSGSTGSS